jgi:hypothetical protein
MLDIFSAKEAVPVGTSVLLNIPIMSKVFVSYKLI